MRTFEAMLILVISISVIGAHAELQSVNIPFPGPYELACTYSVGAYLIFDCNWRSSSIPEDVKAELENLEEKSDILPDKEYEFVRTQIITDWLSPPEPELIPEPELTPGMITIEKKKAQLQVETKQTLSELDKCLANVEPFKRIMQEGYIESLRIPVEYYDIDDYATFQNKVEVLANKNLAICNAILEFEERIVQYEDIELDKEPEIITLHDVVVKTLTAKQQERADYLQRLTDEEQRIKSEIDFPYIDPNQGCVPRDETDTRCENRGVPEPYIKTPGDYNAYIEAYAINKEESKTDVKLNYADVVVLLCDAYKTQYAHKNYTEMDPWIKQCFTKEMYEESQK